MQFILPILLALPLLGALIVAVATPKNKQQTAAYLSFGASLLPLALVVWLITQFNFAASSTWQFGVEYLWLSQLHVNLSLAIDSISLWLIVLTAFITPLAILGSFKYIKDRQKEFYIWLLILHMGMLGVFMARDILLFYLFFEFTLIPMFFIIGIWGGAERRRAAGKFFLFTFAASVFTLAALLYMVYLQYTMSPAHKFSFLLADLQAFGPTLPTSVQYWLFIGLLAGFAVKVPLFPVHTWLPLAHTEAPTAGSVILAGVLLKLGTYAILRFLLPVLPAATMFFAPIIAVICIIGIIYGALVSWVQGDMKKLIAYSSVSHLAFCVIGMFALTPEGLTGSVLYMINHGLSTGALFLVVGMIYERYHTRDMNELSGLARRLPALGFFAIFFVFSSVALPGLNGFVSEFLVLLGTFGSGSVFTSGSTSQVLGNLGPSYAIPAITGVILGAVYLLYWAGRVIFGPLKEVAHEHHDNDAAHGVTKDLSVREWCVLTPIALVVIFLGVYPKPVVDSLQAPVTNIATIVATRAPEGKIADQKMADAEKKAADAKKRAEKAAAKKKP